MNQHDNKYQSLNKANSRIKVNLLSLKPLATLNELFEHLGYEEVSEDRLEFTSRNYGQLVKDANLIDYECKKLNKLLNGDEEETNMVDIA